MHPRVYPLLLAGLIAGCASTERPRPQSSVGDKIAACMRATPSSAEWLAVDVPAARGAIANKLAAATLSVGGSNTVDMLVGLLGRSNRHAVAVFGEDDELAAATLETALRRLPAGASASAQPVCFVGDDRHAEALKTAAQDKGIRLVAVTPGRVAKP